MRIPPHSADAEQSVLGGLLLDNNALDRIAGMLAPDDFYSSYHGEIYCVIAGMIERGEPADVITVAEAMGANADLPYLSSLSQNTPTAANIKRYAEIVLNKSVERKLQAAAAEIIELTESAGDTKEKLSKAQSIMFSLEQRETGSVRKISDVLMKAIENLDTRFLSNSDISGLSTGFVDLDELTAGLQRKDLILVAARPSMGKTAFALQVAEHVALSGNTALVFSLEMGDEQLVQRELSGIARVNSQRIRTGKLYDQDWQKISGAIEKLQDLNLFIDDTPAISLSEIRAKARKVKRTSGLNLIVIDYLQLMGGGRGNTRNEEIGDLTRGLKALGKEFDVPVVALSQLSRKCEERADKRPMMSDLRESGQIEQDADLIMFIYRDEVYDKQSLAKGTAEIIIGKQRNGPLGVVRLTFLGEYTRFENYAGPVIVQQKPVSNFRRGFEYE